MNSRLRVFFLLLLLSILPAGCGEADGAANSGSLNFYNFIYFGNFGSSTITQYHIKSDGTTILVADTITTGVGTSSVNDIVASPDGKFLYASNKSSNNLSWYSIDQLSSATEGKLTYVSTADSLGTGTSATAIHPNGNVCFIANSTSVVNNLRVCTIDKTTGAMTISTDLIYTARTNPTNLVLSPDGRYLYVVNRGTSDISTFAVNSVNGGLTTIDLSTAAGSAPEDLVIHPAGRFLYTLSTGTNQIILHQVSGGSLTPLFVPSVATDANPKKIAISPNGNFVFVTNFGSDTISIYSVNSTSGILTALTSYAGPAGAGFYAVGVTPDNKYLIATGDTSRKAYIHSISESGVLTQIGELPLGSNPRAIKIVPLTVVE